MCLRADGGSDGSPVKTASCDENDPQQVRHFSSLPLTSLLVQKLVRNRCPARKKTHVKLRNLFAVARGGAGGA